jgi:hypothetical protein
VVANIVTELSLMYALEGHLEPAYLVPFLALNLTGLVIYTLLAALFVRVG